MKKNKKNEHNYPKSSKIFLLIFNFLKYYILFHLISIYLQMGRVEQSVKLVCDLLYEQDRTIRLCAVKVKKKIYQCLIFFFFSFLFFFGVRFCQMNLNKLFTRNRNPSKILASSDP